MAPMQVRGCEKCGLEFVGASGMWVHGHASLHFSLPTRECKNLENRAVNSDRREIPADRCGFWLAGYAGSWGILR